MYPINHWLGKNGEMKISPSKQPNSTTKDQQKYQNHQNIELRTNRFMVYFGIFFGIFYDIWVRWKMEL